LILSTFEYFRPGLWQGEIESKGAKERGGNGGFPSRSTERCT
jgi:hypothetical protein